MSMQIRSRKSFFDRPAVVIDAVADRSAAYAYLFSPKCDGLSLAVKSNWVIISLIIVLFGAGSPLTVLRGIAEVIVFTLKRFTNRLLAHIGVEVFKFEPTVTDTNTATAVVRKVFVGGNGRALNHLMPKHINRGITHSVSAFHRYILPYFTGLLRAKYATAAAVFGGA